MSTILDALKKVEQERETESASSRQRQLDALSPTSAKQRQQRHTRKYIIWGALALLVLFLGGTTFYLFFGDRQPPPSHASHPIANPPKAATPEKKAKRTVIAKSKKRVGNTSVRQHLPQTTQRRESLSQRRADSTEAPSRRPFHPPNNIEPANPKEGRATVSETAKRPPANAPPVTAIPAPIQSPKQLPKPPEQKKAAAPPEPQVSPKPKPAPTQSNIPRLTDGSLQVQAIAWSPKPEESMAVINSKIVREGGSVDDFAIVRIREDDVVVRGGGGEWRVVIGRN